MKIVVQDEWYSLQQCKDEPNKMFIFGDNTKHVGNGGQAQIRPAKNAIGLVTKRLPSMDDESFFNDSMDDYISMLTDIVKLYKLATDIRYNDWTLVFPKDGLGTGLSELPTRAPFINQQLMLLLHQYFGIQTLQDGSLIKLDVVVVT